MIEHADELESERDIVESSEPRVTQNLAPTIGNDRVRIRAYELYEKRSGAAGDAETDWYQAEAEIRAEGTQPQK